MSAGPTRRRPRGLLLDAMGTLIGLRRPVGEGYAAVAASFGLGWNSDAINRIFPQVYRQAPPLAFPELDAQALQQAELDWWGLRIAEVLAQAGEPPPPPELVQALFDHYGQATAWRVYAEVPEQLRRWRELGLQLAVVSNFDGRLPGLLEQLHLHHWFDAVVISSRAGAKPDPAPFHRALEALGLSAQQTWHVGDSDDDRRGAQAAGVPFVRVRRP